MKPILYQSTRTFSAILIICVVLLSVVRVPTASAQKEEGIQRDYNAQSGKVTRITGDSNAPIFIPIPNAMATDNMTSFERTDVLIHRFAPEFGLTRPQEELHLAEEVQPSTDRIVTRYQQVYNGIPVMAGELIVNASDQGALYSMNGEVAQGLSLDTAHPFPLKPPLPLQSKPW